MIYFIFQSRFEKKYNKPYLGKFLRQEHFKSHQSFIFSSHPLFICGTESCPPQKKGGYFVEVEHFFINCSMKFPAQMHLVSLKYYQLDFCHQLFILRITDFRNILDMLFLNYVNLMNCRHTIIIFKNLMSLKLERLSFYIINTGN